ncbi:MAG: ribonuclease G [Gammaproteobacteria bacterium]|nr:ribonuclease G [Gammaproteobacteria bacterium]
MSTEILVNIGAHETRVALVEGGAVQEVYVQRASRHGLVGNIYKGMVKRVLPGMQAAFLDIGLERTAFLHVADMLRPQDGGNGATEFLEENGSRRDDEPHPPIDQLLKEGQDLLVQVIKDPLGSKGARLTTMISIPSRYLVVLPFDPHVGVSAKIEEAAERERLRTAMGALVQKHHAGCGVIVRTAGEGADEQALETDFQFLLRLWNSISEHARVMPPPSLVHGDLPLSMRILRDLLGTEVDRVRVDNAEEGRRLTAFARTFVSRAADRIELYDAQAPIFDLYGVEDDINRALDRRVELKSGGHLFIDQTEAMTTIDVNTGAYTGHRNLEETILKTNLEAAQAIARQLRLRNLGGIIILDFIDMRDEGHRAQVLRTLEKELKRDPARTQIHPFSQLGLIEMTRKRTRESLGHILCEPCAACQGRGTVKTIETVCNEIFREIQRSARQFESKALMVIAAPSVIERLMEEDSGGLAEMESNLQRPIRLQAESLYAQESFDVVPM